jgi:hypothetical protein
MTTDACWLCAVPLSSLSSRYWQARCTCGGELAVHGLRHPHPIPLVECRGFTLDLARTTPEPDADAQQPALFE